MTDRVGSNLPHYLSLQKRKGLKLVVNVYFVRERIQSEQVIKFKKNSQIVSGVSLNTYVELYYIWS